MDVITKLKDPEFWTERVLHDLYFACRTVFCTMEDPTNGYKDLYYPTHKRLCDFVQNYAKEGQVLLVLTPRHWIKSYIITVGWYIQRLLNNLVSGNREIVIINNATWDNALLFLKKIKFNLKDNDFLRFLFARYIPDNVVESEEWTKDCIEISGNRLELGSIEKNLVSRHYQVMINDDLVNKENSATTDQLTKVHEWWGLSHSLLHPRGIEIDIGTRWTFDDNYGIIMEKFLNIPRGYGEDQAIWEWHNGRYHLLHMECWADPINRKGSTFPILFPEHVLKELEKQLGDDFYGQYENNPARKGINPFKKEWFKRWIPVMRPDVRYTIMLCDPSGRARGNESSNSGIVVVSLGADQKGYVEFASGEKITDFRLAERLVDLAMRYRPDMIGIEDVKYDSMRDHIIAVIGNITRNQRVTDKEDLDYLQSLPGLLIELKPHGRPKEVRIKQLTGYIQNGTFLFPFQGAEQLEEELIRFPSPKNDIVDAFAYILDNLVFPRKEDQPKYVLPDKLKKTDEELLEEEWESVREIAMHNGNPIEGFLDAELY